MLHVTRDAAGRRRLAEIAVLGREPAGLVVAATAWHVERGPAGGMAALQRLIDGGQP